MAAAGITLIKSFLYKGATEEWSNQYHVVNGGVNPADWRAIVDGLVAQEKTLYSSRVTILRALCYDDTDDDSVYTYDLAAFGGVVSGTLSATAGQASGGDEAFWVRWDTGDRSSTGKPVYLRKYFHDVQRSSPPAQDAIAGAQKTAADAFATALMSMLTGGFILAKKDGVAPDGPALGGTYATTRTLHRRGRRP
jgi:hypothetical protein